MEQNKGGVRNAGTGILKTNINEMKMLIVTLILMAFLSDLAAPPYPVCYIAMPEEINYYDPLIIAIVNYESKGDVFAFNFLEQAAGPMQIRPIRINHYNKLTGSNYTTADCFDMKLSRKVFLRFCKDRSYEVVAKEWNGSGPLTIGYWKQIKARL